VIIMKFATVGLLGMMVVTALAQVPSLSDSAQVRAGRDNGNRDSLPRSDKASNIIPADTSSNVAPTLPSPGLSENATPRDYLRAARASLAAGRTGEAQQSLEMAETREPGGSAQPSQATQSSGNPRVVEIRDALHALGAGDSSHAIHIIDVALGN
jgi:hypothetical protein